MLITGAGTVGLLTMLAARAAGATVVVCTDMVAGKRAAATSMGATAALPAACTPQEARGANDGRGYDVCIECCGAASALRLCVRWSCQRTVARVAVARVVARGSGVWGRGGCHGRWVGGWCAVAS